MSISHREMFGAILWEEKSEEISWGFVKEIFRRVKFSRETSGDFFCGVGIGWWLFFHRANVRVELPIMDV